MVLSNHSHSNALPSSPTRSMTISATPLATLFPYAFPPNKRANTLAIKNALAALLTPSQGQRYWTLLCSLLTGRISRDEFEFGWVSELDLDESDEGEGELARRVEELHNALLLSILYNTTRAAQPPAGVLHAGWGNKRKRGSEESGQVSLLYGLATPGDAREDPLGEVQGKQKRVKAIVGGMTMAERRRIKAIHAASLKEQQANKNKTATAAALASTINPATPPPPPSAAGLKTPNMQPQELARIQSTPTLLESRELPDLQTMQDRMLGQAYMYAAASAAQEAKREAALAATVPPTQPQKSQQVLQIEPQASMLACVALNVSALLSLCRSSVLMTLPRQHYMRDILTTLIDLAPVAQNAGVTKKQAVSLRDSQLHKNKKATITALQMSSLIQSAPSLLHAQNMPSVERFLAHQHLRSRLPASSASSGDPPRIVKRELDTPTEEAMVQSQIKPEEPADMSMDIDPALLSPPKPNGSQAKTESLEMSLEAMLFPESVQPEKVTDNGVREKDGELDLPKKKKKVIVLDDDDEEGENQRPTTTAGRKGSVHAVAQSDESDEENEDDKRRGIEVRGRKELYELLASILQKGKNLRT